MVSETPPPAYSVSEVGSPTPSDHSLMDQLSPGVCVCVCVCARVRACVCVCVLCCLATQISKPHISLKQETEEVTR